MRKKLSTLLPISMTLVAGLLIVSMTLAGCNGFNEQIIDMKYNYSKAHLISANKCVEIKRWANYEDGDMVQIVLPDDSVILGHSNEIVLVYKNCPYCH